jgi:dTDP-4-amino-4,6-dideoxygalactose transaminase
MPVHLYGQAADLTTIDALCRRRGLGLVEDTAQALGATIDGRAEGSFGVGTFSLYATKNLTTGEGGMITTNDSALADRLRVLRNQGMREKYQYEVAGHNYRMTDLQAALGLPQAAAYGDTVKRRQDNAAFLSQGLGDVPGLRVPTQLPGRSHVWHQYTVLVTDDAPVTRQQLMSGLAERGVASGVYYPRLVHDYACYVDHPGVVVDPTPVAQRVARQCLSLPVHHHLSDGDLERIVEAVRAVMG